MAQPLQPQVVPIVFGKLDSKVAPRNAIQGTFVEMLNTQMLQTGRIVSKPGYTKICTPPAGLTVKSMVTMGSELVVQDIANIYSYDSVLQTLTLKGAWRNAFPTVDMLVSNASSQSLPDMAIGDGIEVYVYEDTRSGGQIRYVARNTTTGQKVIPDALLASGATVNTPKVVYTNGRFVFFYFDGAGVLKTQTLLSSLASNPTAAVTLTSAVSAQLWDVTVRANNQILLAFMNTGPTQLSVWTIAADTLALTQQVNTGVTLPVTGVVGWLEHNFSDNKMYLGASNGGTNTFLLTLDANNNVTTNTVLDASGSLAVQITGVVDTSTTPVTKYVFWQRNEVANKSLFNSIGFATVNATVTVGSVAGSVGLASKAFMYLGHPHVIGTYEGGQNLVGALTNQQTYFLFRVNDQFASHNNLLARIMPSLGTGMRTRINSLAGIKAVSTTQFVTPLLRKVQVATEASVNVIVKSVTRTLLDMQLDTGEVSPPRVAGQGLVIPGGCPSFFDGSAVTELGYHVSPEQPQPVASSTVGAMVGTYYYKQVFAWFDNFGRLHRSAPSQESPAVTVNGTTNTSVYIASVQSLRLTSKANVIVELYRRNPGDVNFYKVTSSLTPIFNVSGSWGSGNYTDLLADSEARTREILYATGGILPNDPPPACKVVGVYKDRVVLAAQDLPGNIWLSKPIVPDIGISFSGDFSMTTDPIDGEVTAVDQLDDKAILFFENTIGFFTGDGPNAAAQGGDWSNIVRMPGLGSTTAASVLRVQEGLLFQASNHGGLYLLDRGLTTGYWGSDVEQYNLNDVVGAVNISGVSQTRFVSSSGSMLVRDDYHKRWNIWSGYAGAGCALWQGLFTWVSSDGSIYQETPGVYLNNGVPITHRVTLAWLNPFGLGGQGRLWRIHLIGDYNPGHKLLLGIRYDQTDDITWETLAIDPDVTSAGTVYGTGVYGTGTYGGSNPGDYRFQAAPAKQRGSAFQFVITDTIAGAVNSAGFDLTGLTLLVGGQPGKLGQLPASKTMVTT